jgi:hypothetical protein
VYYYQIEKEKFDELRANDEVIEEADWDDDVKWEE